MTPILAGPPAAVTAVQTQSRPTDLSSAALNESHHASHPNQTLPGHSAVGSPVAVTESTTAASKAVGQRPDRIDTAAIDGIRTVACVVVASNHWLAWYGEKKLGHVELQVGRGMRASEKNVFDASRKKEKEQPPCATPVKHRVAIRRQPPVRSPRLTTKKAVSLINLRRETGVLLIAFFFGFRAEMRCHKPTVGPARRFATPPHTRLLLDRLMEVLTSPPPPDREGTP